MPFQLDVTFEGLDAIRRQFNPAVLEHAEQQGLTAALIQTETEMVNAATRIIYARPEGSRKRTGLYRASLGSGAAGHIREQGKGYARVGTNLFYAEWLEDGTKPHVIRPRNAKTLRFKGRSGIVFAKVVHHPGTPAFHVLGTALTQGGPRINEAFLRAYMHALSA